MITQRGNRREEIDFRTLEEAFSEAEHWRLDEDRTVIEDLNTGVRLSIAERQGLCRHSITIPVLTEAGEQTGEHRCVECRKII